MKKILSVFCMIACCLKSFAHVYHIEKIASLDLSNERKVFIAFRSAFANESLDESEKLFNKEEQAYFENKEGRLFFHALLDDQIVGYISSNSISSSDVIISEWAIEPAVFDVGLIKELLFVVLVSLNKVQTVRIISPSSNKDLIDIFKGLGFVSLKDSLNDEHIVFEFKKSSKCKLCDLLYGSIWDDEDADDQDDLEGTSTVSAVNSGMSDVYYN